MDKFKLTLFAKILVFICLLSIFVFITYLLAGITYITPTRKAIINNTLILQDGWYWYNPLHRTTITNYPNTFKVLCDLHLQVNDGKRFKCSILIDSKVDEKWVLKNKKSPSVIIPIESLNSYVLDYVGAMNESQLYEQKTKIEIEEAVEAWLMSNINLKTQDNSGIIIQDVKIYTPFIRE